MFASAIPAELRGLPIWAPWEYQPGEGTKPRKVPINARTGRYARRNSPSDFVSFEAAMAYFRRFRRSRPNLCGVGMLAVPPYCVVDLDAMIDPDSGDFDPARADIVSQVGSYTEMSPSGLGLHIVCRALKPGPRCRVPKVEIYGNGDKTPQFICFTGNRLDGCPSGVEDRAVQVRALYEDSFGAAAPAPAPVATRGGTGVVRPVSSYAAAVSDGVTPTVEAVIEKMLNDPQRGSKTRDMWDGGLGGMPSESERDQSLANDVVYYAGTDRGLIEAVFAQSVPGSRHKWRQRKDYRDLTIDKALCGRTQFYLWNRGNRQAASTTSGGLELVNAADLVNRWYAPVAWCVPDFLARGACLFAAKPKIGKTWAALQASLAVASGGRLFDRFDCPEGDVLYLALEDGERRMQSRLKLLLDGADAPRRLQFAYKVPAPGHGFEDAVGGWLKGKANPLVVVDTLSRLRMEEKATANVFQADYRAVECIQRLVADNVGTALIIAHQGKRQSDDFFDTLAGSTGLSAAADGVAVLSRGRGEKVARLAISHRDAEEQDFQLRQAGVRWVSQDADAPPMTGNRMTVLDALASGPRNRAQVAAALRITPNAAGRMLSRMARAEQVVRAAHGIYKLP